MAKEKRASLNPREARICHEAVWVLLASDEAWQTDEIRALEEKLSRYASPEDWQPPSPEEQ